MGRVFVAGSINMDVVATAERHPQLGETVAGREVFYFPGGKGANQAVAANGTPFAMRSKPLTLPPRFAYSAWARRRRCRLRRRSPHVVSSRRTPGPVTADSYCW
jgi:ribokinase